MQTLMDAIFAIVAVYILFAGMAYFLFEPVKAYMQKRTEKIKNDIETASQEKKEALVFKQEYEEKIKNINKEADLILSQARKKALAREEEIVNEAKEEANRIIERAKTEITREKEKVKEDIKNEMVAIATLLAEKFVATSLSDDEQNKMIEQTLNEMGDTTWLN
jgi:F-type H+-transporting ATPase subunit b